MSSSSLGFGEPTYLKPLLPPIFGTKIKQIFELPPPILIDFLMIQSSPKKNGHEITNPPIFLNRGKKHGTRPPSQTPTKTTRRVYRPSHGADPGETPFDPRHSAKSEGLRRVSKTSGTSSGRHFPAKKWMANVVGFVGFFQVRDSTCHYICLFGKYIVYFLFFGGVCFFVCMYVLVHIRILV